MQKLRIRKMCGRRRKRGAECNGMSAGTLQGGNLVNTGREARLLLSSLQAAARGLRQVSLAVPVGSCKALPTVPWLATFFAFGRFRFTFRACYRLTRVCYIGFFRPPPAPQLHSLIAPLAASLASHYHHYAFRAAASIADA
jgi:hypothetical protein